MARRSRVQSTQPDAPEMREELTAVDPKTARRVRFWRHWKKMRWVLWILLMIPVVYVVVQVFIILAPRMRTEVALLDSMTDKLAVRGEVVLESTPITGASGYLYYTVPPGQRVAAEDEVALIFSTEEAVEAMDSLAAIEAELALLNEAQLVVSEGGDLETFLTQAQEGLYGLLDGIERGTYGQLDEARQALAMATNKMQVVTGESAGFESRIASLANQKAQVEQAAVPVGSVTAPVAGYFVPSQQYDRIPLTAETAAQLGPLELKDALERVPRYYSADVAGHIVSDYKWYFYTTVEVRETARFTVGDKSLSLAFPDAMDTAVPVTVNRVVSDEAAGLAMVELACETIGPEVLALRTETAEIIFGEVRGLRIERGALRLVDEANEDGSVATHQGVYVQFGNMVYFRRVQVLIEDESYMLVSDVVSDGVNEVRMYDKVVVDPGGVELYDQRIL